MGRLGVYGAAASCARRVAASGRNVSPPSASQLVFLATLGAFSFFWLDQLVVIHGHPVPVGLLAQGASFLAIAHLTRTWSDNARAFAGAVVIRWLVLLLWATLSILWSPYPNVSPLLAPLIMAALSCVLPAMVLYGSRGLSRNALMLAMAALVTLASVASMFRAAVPWWEGYRFYTPLGSASSNFIPHLICLAIFLGASRNLRRHSSVLYFFALSDAFLIVISMSRIGILLLAIYGVAFYSSFLDSRRNVSRLAISALGAALVLLAALGRFRLSDSARMTNAVTGWEALRAQDLGALWGVGTGGVWPWVAYAYDWFPHDGSGTFPTHWGVALFHPHSIPLAVGVELGIVGFMLLAWTAIALCRILARQLRDQDLMERSVAIAVACSLPAFVVEYYLFNGFGSAMIWWTAVAYLTGTASADSASQDCCQGATLGDPSGEVR